MRYGTERDQPRGYEGSGIHRPSGFHFKTKQKNIVNMLHSDFTGRYTSQKFTGDFTVGSQDLKDRLSLAGITNKDLAEKFGVSPSAVSNWLTRGWPDEVEGYVASLEGGVKAVHIQPGNLVRQGDEIFRVVRRDHCLNLKGKEAWIYWITPARQVEGGYATTGQTTQCPEKLLTDLGVVEWVEFEKPDQSKGGK